MPSAFHHLAAGLTAATAALTAAPAPALAAPPEPVTIVAVVDPGPGFAGTWSGSGAIDDSGGFERSGLHLSGSPEHSRTVGSFQVEIEFTGHDGSTVVLRDELLFTEHGLDGDWQIIGGTGAYSTATGHGTSSFDAASGATRFTGVADLAHAAGHG